MSSKIADLIGKDKEEKLISIITSSLNWTEDWGSDENKAKYIISEILNVFNLIDKKE